MTQDMVLEILTEVFFYNLYYTAPDSGCISHCRTADIIISGDNFNSGDDTYIRSENPCYRSCHYSRASLDDG